MNVQRFDLIFISFRTVGLTKILGTVYKFSYQGTCEWVKSVFFNLFFDLRYFRIY